MDHSTSHGGELGERWSVARCLRRPWVALALIAIVTFDLMVALQGASHHGCVTRWPRAKVFRTPQGVHIVGQYSIEWEQLGLDENAYRVNAPKGWECVGEVSSLPRRRAGGLITRWDSSVVASMGLREWDATPLSTGELAAVRSAFAALLAGPEWGGTFYSRAAALIAAGDGTDDEMIWPAVAHDLIVLSLACGAIYALPSLFPPRRRERRLKLGLCPECAYPLQDLPKPGCPECGWGRENL